MRLLIIGGNGQTGRLVLNEALQRGHKVTALLRNPSSLPAKDGLTIVTGTPVDPVSVESAILAVPGDIPTVVIVTLSGPNEKGTHVMTDANQNLTAAMKKHGVSKIVTMASFGVAESYPNINFLMRFAISRTSLGHQFRDHDKVDEILKKSGVNFVILRPCRLTTSKKGPVHYLGNEGKGLGMWAGMGGISRPSVAAALVDAAEESTWDKTTPVISN